MLTPEFRLTNEVGITGDVRQEPLSFDLDDKECFLRFCKIILILGNASSCSYNLSLTLTNNRCTCI
jgi:hypothetical protein